MRRIAVIAAAALLPVLLAAPASAYNSNASFDAGIKDPVYTVTQSAGGGAALTSASARTLLASTGSPLFSYGVYDCFTGATCGDAEAGQSHAGTISKANFESQLATVKNSFGAPALILQLLPNFRGTLTNGNGTVTGASFCPTLSNPGSSSPASDEWNLDLAADKTVIDAVAASGVTFPSVILEDGNEIWNACAAKWGYTSSAQAGVAKALGHFYSNLMPSLLSYAKAHLPSATTVVAGADIGISGGTARGDSCAANSNFTYGYKCTFVTAKTQVDDFNNTIKADGITAADVPSEDVHSYCHSPDFTTASGYPLPDNECYAFYRQWIGMAHAEAYAIWGSTVGGDIPFSMTEWQAGVCGTTNATCWTGFQDGAGNDTSAYDSGFLAMLKGNGNIFSITGTAYWLGVMFDDAGNADGNGLPGAPDNNAHPAGNYNVINEAGTKGEGYTAFCNATTVGTGC